MPDMTKKDWEVIALLFRFPTWQAARDFALQQELKAKNAKEKARDAKWSADV